MGMSIAELFRETFKVWLENQPRGEQSRLADAIGISRQYMTDFMKGRKMLSEEKREALADLSGFSYVDFLIMGGEMFHDEIDWNSNPYIRYNYINKYRLENIIRTIEATEAKTSKKLSPSEKAELIADLYEDEEKAVISSDSEEEAEEKQKKAEVFNFMKYKAA